MKKNLLLGAFALFFLSTNFLQATNIDGRTTPKWREAAELLSGESIIRGFVVFKGGITLDGSVDTIFDMSGELFGPIDLNNGILKLEHDLTLGSTATLVGDGRISGGGHILFLSSDLTIPGTTSILSDTTIDGGNKILNLASGAALSVASGQTLTLRNMTLMLNSASQITMVDNTSTLVLDNVNVCMAGFNQIFSMGAITIKNRVNLIGPHIFSHESAADFTISSCSTFFVDVDATFKYDPSDNSRIRLVMIDRTSHLHFNGCTFHAPADLVPGDEGVILTKGTVLFENKVTLNNSGNIVNTSSIQFGNLGVDPDPEVKVLAGANVIVDGYFFYNPA